MLWDIFILIAGTRALIMGGANILTDGALGSGARRWGVSDLVVGLTIVAFRHIHAGTGHQRHFRHSGAIPG